MVTPLLQLTELDSSTNNKYLIHNEALREIETLGLGSIIDFLSAPPGSPAIGDTYLVRPTATGIWIGQDNNFATYNGSGWDFLGARAHARVFVRKLGLNLQFSFAGPNAWYQTEETVNYVVSANLTATMATEKVIVFDTGATPRTLTLPNPGAFSASFHVINSLNTQNITVQNHLSVTVRILGPGTVKSAWFYWLPSTTSWVASL